MDTHLTELAGLNWNISFLNIGKFDGSLIIAPLWKSGGYTGFALSFRGSVIP